MTKRETYVKMRNLKLQQIFSRPLAFSTFDADHNHFATSRDGKSFIAITYQTISLKVREKVSKSIHVCYTQIDANKISKEQVPETIPLRDIIHDAEEEELHTAAQNYKSYTV